MTATAAAIVAGSALTNRPTGVTYGGSAWASASAWANVTWRGLPGWNTRPIASAPASTAAATSSGRDTPQILIRVRALIAAHRSAKPRPQGIHDMAGVRSGIAWTAS